MKTYLHPRVANTINEKRDIYTEPPTLGFRVVRYGFAVMVDSSTPRPDELAPMIERQLGFLFRPEDFDVVLVNKTVL